MLSQVESVEQVIKQFDSQIEEYCHPFNQAVELLDTIPGVARQLEQLGYQVNLEPVSVAS
ncbi:MAG: hypothetical protein V7L23_00355 [Nostoc sp.]|uniref:hypothetical protein n=1 Tax=Nostoc sp. TaxID=1180 RepID=UPI002FF21C54